ncbi:probable NADH dehydrogenase [ubiquinone] 1 alpha subcomplex subunit 12 [Diabrotica virgifera virgifera]|uniref:NADH dehydrogenase [ubiquinone] 1 alpha subcomplex subunit 12 n=1 Tax=Diabrotica virgifera virgifera TaxID=50390 RepID=A0A6P7FCC9_DIAVI|nr:probable NADH dehydrogenase [ubiquinone] 1 alpha subcomplex subunit 12 [Diabrotica virgifera virgifera]
MAKYFGIDKFFVFLNTIKEAGGIRASLYKLYRMDNLRPGTLVGTDKYGNKYYENPHYFYGRNRWIEYAPYYGLDYDGSQVPAEWFGWLHYKTDLTPDKDPSRPKYKWMADHTENLSGTPGQYMPYSTTRPKIEAWTPPGK